MRMEIAIGIIECFYMFKILVYRCNIMHTTMGCAHDQKVTTIITDHNCHNEYTVNILQESYMVRHKNRMYFKNREKTQNIDQIKFSLYSQYFCNYFSLYCMDHNT
jgi:hypothetical protein